jgi:hypothetical protein
VNGKIVVLTSMQPVAQPVTTGSSQAINTWRSTVGAAQPAHAR